MYKYVPGEVYNNLKEFIVSRGIHTDYKFLPVDKFSDMLNTYEYVKLEGERTDSRGVNVLVTIFLIMPKSRYALKAADFKKLFNSLPKNRLENAEVMFISEEELTNHIQKQIDELRMEHKTLYIESYTYDKFIIVIPKHVGVPKHVIASREEIDQWCEEYGTNRSDLPKILASDPPVVWLGAKPGDIVKIYRYSESAGHAIAMRYVIHG
jgi:DNA-directed RNA polymerase subunit H (RpoH/RPB5)